MRALLPMSYKGARNYLQGGDIYNALSSNSFLITGSPDAYVSRLTFRRFCRNLPIVCTDAPPTSATVMGEVKFYSQSGGHLVNAWLAESEDRVLASVPFDEESLVPLSRVDADERRAIMFSRSSYSPIEEVIALTKRLNYSLCPLKDGKWVFGQADFRSALTDDYTQLEIHTTNLFPNRFSVNEIKLDGSLAGSIRFIVGEP